MGGLNITLVKPCSNPWGALDRLWRGVVPEVCPAGSSSIQLRLTLQPKVVPYQLEAALAVNCSASLGGGRFGDKLTYLSTDTAGM